MDGVGTPIIERPRPLHKHDTPNATQHPYSLKCEEPLYHRTLLKPHGCQTVNNAQQAVQ